MGKREREEGVDGGGIIAAFATPSEEEYGANSCFSFPFEEDDDDEGMGLNRSVEDDENDYDCLLYNSYINNEDDKEEEEGFAAGFYRCGTDCSSLLSSFGEGEKEGVVVASNPNPNPKLKQSNLFQIWDLKTNHPFITTDNNKKKKKKKPKQANLFQMPGWGHLSSKDNNNNPSYSSSSIISTRTANTTTSSNNSSSKNRVIITKHPPPPPPRPCPFYKKIPGTPFTVDAFRFGAIQGCRGYILTHFHADHYGGLTKSWSHGPIYCSPLTARLLTICLYVQPQYIHPLELDTEYVVEGIAVTLLEANHCPGAALIHLRLPNGQCVLHTGDFRASKSMQQYPLLSDQRVNVVYLDTTYCNQKYSFPAKEDVLRFVVREVENRLRNQPKSLIVVGAYSIGKECVYIAISKSLGVKIHADSKRRRVLQSFGWSELSSNLSSDGKETPLHILPMSSLKFEVLERYLKTYSNRYTAVLAFRPTGWTYSESIGHHLDLIKPISKGRVTIYGVPYSEHSSFLELEEFIKFLRPDKIIPTVNVGNAAHREKMQTYFRDWLKR